MPDGSLEVVKELALACGTQRSDTSTLVFCVDSTPRVVWSKVEPVASGLLRQVDQDVMVIASDRWAHAVSSVVLRTGDGTALLHLPSVRLGAALAAQTRFNGALSSDPVVTFYDAGGQAKWTWAGGHAEALRAEQYGNEVIVALYSPIATGTSLAALDARTGALVWQGAVDSLPISHSKYSNRVELDDRGGNILLIGRESSQEFAQAFDAETGKRVASIVRGR
jgi:outer membrane protein assembly factor BamB